MDTRKYVLYADDDQEDRELLSDAFASFPEYTLLVFQTGVDMLAFIDLKAGSLDVRLIISDINMPVMNGIETLRCLKSSIHSKDIPTFLYSTSTNAIDVMVAETMNTRIFKKPTLFSEVLEIIKTTLLECHEPIH